MQLDQVQKQINKNIETKLELMQTEQEFSVYTNKIVALEQEQLVNRQKMQDAWGQNWFTEFLQGFGDYENTKSVLDDQYVHNEKVIKQLKKLQKDKKEKLVGLMADQQTIEVQQTLFEDPDADTDTGTGTGTKRKKLNTDLRRGVDLKKENIKLLKEEKKFMDILNKTSRELSIKELDRLIEGEKANSRTY